MKSPILYHFTLILYIQGHLYRSLGCWKDKKDSRAIPKIEGSNDLLKDAYSERVGPIEKCLKVAASRSFTIFAIQNSGACFTSEDARHTYWKHGKSSDCHRTGEGGAWANQVYEIENGTFTGHPHK